MLLLLPGAGILLLYPLVTWCYHAAFTYSYYLVLACCSSILLLPGATMLLLLPGAGMLLLYPVHLSLTYPDLFPFRVTVNKIFNLFKYLLLLFFSFFYSPVELYTNL
jgi:hypothetical protein